MKGFFIDISNGLLDSKHVAAMGPAVWEFMWCLDKITKIDEHGIGWVLGGKPIKLEEITKTLGKHKNRVSEHLTRLQDEGYIFKLQAPYGIIITVAKAKKRFTKTAKARITNIVKARPDFGDSNKTVSVDNKSISSWTKSLLQKLEERRGVKIVTVGPQVQALGKLKNVGLDPNAIWGKLQELENKSEFWRENPPDFVNLANNFHKLKGQQSARYRRVLPKKPS